MTFSRYVRDADWNYIVFLFCTNENVDRDTVRRVLGEHHLFIIIKQFCFIIITSEAKRPERVFENIIHLWLLLTWEQKKFEEARSSHRRSFGFWKLLFSNMCYDWIGYEIYSKVNVWSFNRTFSPVSTACNNVLCAVEWQEGWNARLTRHVNGMPNSVTRVYIYIYIIFFRSIACVWYTTETNMLKKAATTRDFSTKSRGII